MTAACSDNQGIVVGHAAPEKRDAICETLIGAAVDVWKKTVNRRVRDPGRKLQRVDADTWDDGTEQPVGIQIGNCDSLSPAFTTRMIA
jgi:hypothetical protein